MHILLEVKMKRRCFTKLMEPICPVCGYLCSITKSGRLSVHDPEGYGNCPGSRKVVYYDIKLIHE